jgi:hypothetical protein
MDVIRTFKKEEIKDAKAVSEVVCLAPALEKDAFRDLLMEFYNGFNHSDLLDFHQLEGLAQLIQGADSGYLHADDLVKILGLLTTRLQNTQNNHRSTCSGSYWWHHTSWMQWPILMLQDWIVRLFISRSCRASTH